jgi:hypothetical protein
MELCVRLACNLTFFMVLSVYHLYINDLRQYVFTFHLVLHKKQHIAIVTAWGLTYITIYIIIIYTINKFRSSFIKVIGQIYGWPLNWLSLLRKENVGFHDLMRRILAFLIKTTIHPLNWFSLLCKENVGFHDLLKIILASLIKTTVKESVVTPLTTICVNELKITIWQIALNFSFQNTITDYNIKIFYWIKQSV